MAESEQSTDGVYLLKGCVRFTVCCSMQRKCSDRQADCLNEASLNLKNCLWFFFYFLLCFLSHTSDVAQSMVIYQSVSQSVFGKIS